MTAPERSEVSLPSQFQAISPELHDVVHRLLDLGEAVNQAFGTPAYAGLREQFEQAVEETLDNSRISFLLSDLHPIFDTSWIGFLRYYIGEAVGGRNELPTRIIRGVGDKSGKK